ncbi:amidohydrolase [Shewanella sp. Scap07]|uniref:M20 aminoacylase family protein n=1 Tax=Shewanella sp. Scap07 TaxID=2589987 RepID=UPI0015BE287C|nr:M20 aminoacylase family protein [Shewanella sp. Scap07]QLE86587.1 amidohydrolase [Shewanella sp. Scap07]
MINELKQHNEMFSQWRKAIHQHPELGFEEQQTADFVANKLRQWGLDEVHTGIATTGVVGVLRGQSPNSRAIGLRADMDALALDEANDFSHASHIAGKMHACGHDGHTAILLASAWYLAQNRNFNGTVYFIFQPAEEGLGGAQAMIDDGLFERFKCDRIYALHNMPGIAQSHIWLKPGPLMASADRFDIAIEAKGGHAAMPQHLIDPSLVMSNIILSAQTIVSRNTSPLDTCVISFTDIHSGEGTYNVVPDSAQLKGCLRTFNPQVRQQALERLQQVVEQTAKLYGAKASLTIQPGSYPATVNEQHSYEFAANIAEQLLGKERVNTHCDPLSGSEDFSFMLNKVAGCYLLLGNGLSGEKGGVCVHNPHYDFNDDIIPVGAALFCSLVTAELK